jgi:hypothetical protein
MFCEVNNDFVRLHPRLNILGLVRNDYSQELAHHQVQVQRTQMRRQVTHNELKQIQCFQVNFTVVISEYMSQQQTERLYKVFRCHLIDDSKPLLNYFFDFDNCDQSLLRVWEFELVQLVFTAFEQLHD